MGESDLYTRMNQQLTDPYLQCKRVLTVRELARSQGFPDHFQFYSIKDKDVKTVSYLMESTEQAHIDTMSRRCSAKLEMRFLGLSVSNLVGS